MLPVHGMDLGVVLNLDAAGVGMHVMAEGAILALHVVDAGLVVFVLVHFRSLHHVL